VVAGSVVAGSVVAAEADSAEEARVAAGKAIISRRGRRIIDDAVRTAEQKTGLQFCVYLGPATDDTRTHAQELFVQAGLHERPAVLIHVSPAQKHVEIVTAPDARARIPDDGANEAIGVMTEYFARGDYVEGLLVGINELAERAGRGAPPPGATDLPNVTG
jgi:uncharacterized membrane protein YgcG